MFASPIGIFLGGYSYFMVRKMYIIWIELNLFQIFKCDHNN